MVERTAIFTLLVERMKTAIDEVISAFQEKL